MQPNSFQRQGAAWDSQLMTARDRIKNEMQKYQDELDRLDRELRETLLVEHFLGLRQWEEVRTTKDRIRDLREQIEDLKTIERALPRYEAWVRGYKTAARAYADAVAAGASSERLTRLRSKLQQTSYGRV